ncbi:ABC transporter substrate-binding protein [Clostridium oceanicum]|uniref:MetQ/NlpA family ABC transporter substrate-binding protein n=1 Tax=Clostridium oceanicum TaxID=1543 RepID=A0ABP3UQF4_9CLOT
MKKKLFLPLLILIFSIALIGCSTTKKELKESTSKESQNLTIGVMPDLDSIPFVIAKNNGYFDDEGIKVNIKHFKSAVDRDSALQTNNLDGAISDMISVALLNEKKFNIKMTSKTDGSFKLISSKNSNIENTNNINNKTIGISKNTIIEYLTDKMTKSPNTNSNNIKKIAVSKIPTRLEMLKNNKLDMATLPEPLATVAVLDGGNALKDSNKSEINAGVLIFTEKSINSKEDSIKKLYKAYNKAVDYINTEKKEKYIDLVIKECGFPPTIKDSLALPKYTKATLPSKSEFEEVLKWSKSKKLIKTDLNFDDVTNNNLIK